MNDPEVKAITETTKLFDRLSEDQRHNVLLYLNARYGNSASLRSSLKPKIDQSEAKSGTEFESLGDFFDAADPQTESDRVLVVAYWGQVVENVSDFESFPINQQLKNLGYPVSNITRALDTLINQSPRLVLQTSKSGNAKQARKRFKVTREGIKRVQSMLNQNNGVTND
jgi:hypothetical protein